MRQFNLQSFSVIFSIIFFLLILSWLKFIYLPVVTTPEGLHYTVKSGTTIRAVIDDLYLKKIISNRYYFNLLVRLKKNAQDLKAGEYLFKKGSTPATMLNQMVTGSGIIYHEFTIVPGWNFNELRAALLKEESFHHSLNQWSNQMIMAYLKNPESSPEGLFFPDTYYFSEGSSDIALLKRAYNTMQIKIKEAWSKRQAGLPFNNDYEVLIAASLVEKEAYLRRERPLIAGVLVNRLLNGMILQFDPTVIYGLGIRFNGKISKEDLQIDTPYNTYIHKGLPPTPIAMPSYESILAVLHPAPHHFLYFVARGDGSHQFSENLNDHKAAIAAIKKINSGIFFNDDLLASYLNSYLGQKKQLSQMMSRL